MTKPIQIWGKWALYALVLLVGFVVQSVVLGHVRFWQTKLALLPVIVACVAARESLESGGLFGLLAGLFWVFSGDAESSLCIAMLTVLGTVAGHICGTYLTKNLLPTMLMCLLGLVLCQGGAFGLRWYLGSALPPQAHMLVLIQIGLSMLAAPVCWIVCRQIGQIGRG